MTTILRSTDAGFTNDVPRARLPFTSDCLGYFLFGGSNATDVKNRMVDSADLIAVGGGALAHTAATATLSVTAGYRTPFNLTPYACTAIYVGDIPTEDMAGTAGNQFGNPSTQSLYPLSLVTGRLSLTNGSGGEDTVTNSGTATLSVPSPGLIAYKTRQQFRAVVEDGGTLAYYAEEWSALRVFMLTGQATPAASASQILIGAGKFGQSYSRASAAAFYGRALSEAEIRAVFTQIKRDNRARGIRV